MCYNIHNSVICHKIVETTKNIQKTFPTKSIPTNFNKKR